MFQKIGVILFFTCIVQIQSFGQSEITDQSISPAEHALLDFVTADTVHDLKLDLFKENLRFGVPNQLSNGISLLKNKNQLFLQLMGSGRLYQVLKKERGGYLFKRLDSTFHTGVNFGCINLFYKDTLFQLGGIGFWKIKDHFTFFSTKTHEWELFSTKKGISVFQSPEKGIIYYTDQLNGKFYLSNSIFQMDFPNSLTTSFSDTCRVFDFKERTWKNLGKLNPALKEIAQKNLDIKSSYGPYIVFHSDLFLFWVNFSTNQYGNVLLDKQAEFREKWLKIYKGRPEHMYQFMVGTNYYLIRIEKDGQLTYETIELNEKHFVDRTAQPIYSNHWMDLFLQKIEPGKPIIGNIFVVLMVLLLHALYNKKVKKKKTPLEVQIYLYKNFYSALSVIEKELIQSMYQIQINNEQISIKAINKIIGVQQKDTITQNKSRSDCFLRINQKFKLATRASEALIVKQRESTDKRVYNYNINNEFMEEIKKLILHNQ